MGEKGIAVGSDLVVLPAVLLQLKSLLSGGKTPQACKKVYVH